LAPRAKHEFRTYTSVALTATSNGSLLCVILKHLRGHGETLKWEIIVGDDQQQWQDFCESFMSEAITIERRWKYKIESGERRYYIHVTCIIDMNPYEPIDSTCSMPSFIIQAKSRGFKQISVVHV
jgi:ABC-type phosphate transport system permease subunit